VIGVGEGFAIDGLYGNLSDLWQMGKAIVYYTNPWTISGFVGDSVGSWWSGNWEGSQAKQLGDTAKAVYAKAKEIGDELLKFAENNPRLAKDILLGLTPGGALPALVDAGLSDEGQALLVAAAPRLQAIYAEVAGKFGNLPAEKRGEILGRITGFVLYQATETYLLAGIGKVVTVAAKSEKVTATLYKVQKLLDAIPGIQWLDEGKVISKAIDALATDIAFLFKTRICFVAGTPIHTLEGLKNIEDIRPGDLVLTRAAEDGTQRVAPAYKPVLQTFVTHPDALYHVTLMTDAGETETLSTTAGHPFYVVGKEAFVQAQNLKAGDRLVLPEGRSAVVTAVHIERAAPGKTFTTYNFAVAETRTYFAGRQGVWVHNLSDNPCKLLAAAYLDDVARGMSSDKALLKMAKDADNMVASGKLSSARARNRHLRDAIDDLIAKGDLAPGYQPPPGLIKQTLGYAPSSEILGENLELMGRKRLPNRAAHHIVAGEDPRAAQARRILKQAGIDINDADNGVFLPRGSKYAKGAETPHSRVHTDLYYKTLTERLQKAAPGTLRDVLEEIGQELLNGTFPY
jgi:hypothetical protein